MQRFFLSVGCIFVFAAAVSFAQQPEPSQPADQTTTLTVQSTLVQVPVQVKTKSGKNVFALTAENFVLTDNGEPQKINLDDDIGAQPLALAVVVETGASGAAHVGDYRGLDAILDALIGSVDHRVGVIGFDSNPHLLVPFTPNTAEASKELDTLQAGDNGGAILDAVAFAVGELRKQPPNFRRAILLISETLDQGSTTTLTDALRMISDTNTTMYTFGFSSTKSQVKHEAGKFHYGNPGEPGPARGCFSREGAESEYNGHYSKQVLDCISMLAPPVRFATMAFVAARDSLRTNTTESIAQLTGGEFVKFKNAKDLQKGLVNVINDVPNFYMLSFHPANPAPGMHALQVGVKDQPPVEIKARSAYWIDEK